MENDKINKSIETSKFLNSKFYTQYFKPHLEKQIKKFKNIKELLKDENKILNNFYKNIGSMEAYQSMLNTIEKQWIELKIKDEGGGEHK